MYMFDSVVQLQQSSNCPLRENFQNIKRSNYSVHPDNVDWMTLVTQSKG